MNKLLELFSDIAEITLQEIYDQSGQDLQRAIDTLLLITNPRETVVNEKTVEQVFEVRSLVDITTDVIASKYLSIFPYEFLSPEMQSKIIRKGFPKRFQSTKHLRNIAISGKLLW